MGLETQEARSIPRNRKCGNCRFYEPAPLWRKGWCRNPKLYPPHANHLVDATTIDCEGGFRSRIYWEPLAVADENVQAQETAPRNVRPQAAPPPPIYHIQSKPVEQQPPIGNIRPATPAPAQMPPQPQPQPRFQRVPEPMPEPEPEPMPIVDAVVIEHPTEPMQVFQPDAEKTDWRENLRRNLPMARNWPLEKLYWGRTSPLPWVVGGIAAILVLFVFFGAINNKGNNNNPNITNPNNNGASIVGAIPTGIQGTVAAVKQATQQAAITTVAATPSPTTAPTKTGTISGNGPTPLNLRDSASIKGKLVTTIQEGEKVTILDGPKDADGHSWYQISYDGKTGWAVKDYIQIQP